MRWSKTLSRTLAGACMGVMALAASASTGAGESKSSGFLPPAIESKMQEVKIDDDRKALRWISTDLTYANYGAVMVDRVIFYPAPNPGPQVSSSTLEKVADYLTEALRREIGAAVKVVDVGGPGVLRLQPAITAVVVKKEGLGVADVLPAHLVFSAASAATGHMDEDVTAHVEVRITDSVSRADRAAVRTDLEGKQLDNEKDQLTLEDMKAALDQGAAAAARSVNQALRAP